MNRLFQKYAQHLDELRINAGIRTVDFCNDVCDDRTYRRYLSGDTIMSQSKLNALCKKLGITVEEFYRSFRRSDIEETQAIYSLLRALQQNSVEESKKLLAILDPSKFINPRSNEIYNYCVILHNIRTKKVNQYHAHDLLSNLIDYPRCLQKNAFDLIDLLALTELSILETVIGDRTALNVLIELIAKDEKIYITSDERYYLPSIYSFVANALGRFGDLQQSLEVCQKGIDYSLRINDMYALDHLYYYQSLNLYKLGYKNEALDAARKSLFTAYIKGNQAFLNRMHSVMEKDFGIDPITLVQFDSWDDIIKK